MRSLKLVVFFTAKSLVRLSWRPIFPACPSVVSVWRSGRESIRRFERQVVDLQWEQGQEEVQLQEQGSWCRSMSVELLGEGIDRWLLLPSLCPSGQVRRGQNHYLHSSRWWVRVDEVCCSLCRWWPLGIVSLITSTFLSVFFPTTKRMYVCTVVAANGTSPPPLSLWMWSWLPTSASRSALRTSSWRFLYLPILLRSSTRYVEQGE